MFTKIDVGFPEFDVNTLSISAKYLNGVFKEFNILNKSYVEDIIFGKIHFSVKPDSIILTTIEYPGAAAHTDAYPVVFNIYLDAEDTATIFWKSNLGKIKCRLSTTYVSKLDLEEIARIYVKKGECYILDTHVIHSVEMQKPGKVRNILKCVWTNTSYDTVVNGIHVNYA